MADLGIIFLRRRYPSTDTSHFISLLPEVCRSVLFGPPCIGVNFFFIFSNFPADALVIVKLWYSMKQRRVHISGLNLGELLSLIILLLQFLFRKRVQILAQKSFLCIRKTKDVTNLCITSKLLLWAWQSIAEWLPTNCWFCDNQSPIGFQLLMMIRISVGVRSPSDWQLVGDWSATGRQPIVDRKIGR